MELIKIFPTFNHIWENIKPMYEYLCNSCSKTWLSETKIEGVN